MTRAPSTSRGAFAVGLAVLACSSSSPQSPPPAPSGALRAEVVASGLTDPLYLTAPAGDARLFIVEQRGRILLFKNGKLLTTPFLDLTDRVGSGGERGLLSLAFHPSYATNGFFYVDYTNRNGDTRVERYHVSADPDVGDRNSASLVLGVKQPFANHNGGHILFGPDGKLYIAMGDGGSGGDPQGNGQSLRTHLGKLLRIDIDAAQPYAVPPDNPFVDRQDALPEIWAYGLRNPWRVAFDPPGGTLYIADVGQNRWEEVDVARDGQGGLNYGWNIMEGDHCFASSPCSSSGLSAPVLEYPHADGCSIIGGAVYRGSAIPAIVGDYFYSDYCSGWLRSFRYANGTATDPQSWDVGALGSVLSFGVDGAGELYILSANGNVYRLAPAP